MYPAECGEQLGTDPSKIGSSKSLVLKSFSGEGTLWDSSLPVSLTLGDTPALLTPPLPLPQKSPEQGDTKSTTKQTRSRRPFANRDSTRLRLWRVVGGGVGLSSSLNAGTAHRGCLGRGEAFSPAICPPKRPRPFAHYRLIYRSIPFGQSGIWGFSGGTTFPVGQFKLQTTKKQTPCCSGKETLAQQNLPRNKPLPQITQTWPRWNQRKGGSTRHLLIFPSFLTDLLPQTKGIRQRGCQIYTLSEPALGICLCLQRFPARHATLVPKNGACFSDSGEGTSRADPPHPGLACCGMLSQDPRSASQGLCGGHQRGSAALCDPNPPRPFAQYRRSNTSPSVGPLKISITDTDFRCPTTSLERPENADLHRKPQIFADSPLLLEIQAFGGRRKPQNFAENRRFSQKTAGNRRLGSVTLGPSPLARPFFALPI